MRSILNIFGRSPFVPLKSHMEIVSQCVYALKELFEAIVIEDQAKVEEVAKDICKKEHNADLIKREIRNNLPKSLFLPIDRSSFLDILTMQDNIADSAEDLAVLMTLKTVKKPDCLKEDFDHFLNTNIEAFDGAVTIIHEMHDLLESSFGGVEAEKVRKMVDEVAFKEHQVDLIQRKLLKQLLNAENELNYTEFYIWQNAISFLASISNLSENLAYRVRTTLELK